MSEMLKTVFEVTETATGNKRMYVAVEEYNQILDRLASAEKLIEECEEVLNRTKKLTQGPSFELQDSIMCEVLEAIAKIRQWREK